MLEHDRETARRNDVLGWMLFGLFLVLLAGVVVVALVYVYVA